MADIDLMNLAGNVSGSQSLRKCAHNGAIRSATVAALIASVVLAILLAAFFVWWVGFRQTDFKFVLVYFGMFFFAPAISILAVFGVFFVTYSARMRLEHTAIKTNVAVATELTGDIEREIIEMQSPSYRLCDEEVGRVIAQSACLCG